MLTAIWPPDLAPVVARLMLADDRLARRLTLAPRETLHMVGAWLYAAVAAGKPAAEMATAIGSRDARDLLAEALPGHPERLPRYLRLLGDRVRSQKTYQRLDALLRGPAAAAIPTTGQIEQDHLSVAELIAHAGGGPLLAAAKAIGTEARDAEALFTVLSFLRAHGLAQDIEALPPGSGWKAIVRRIAADLDRGCGPPPPFSPPSGWACVTRMADLSEIGRGMRLCVGRLDDTGFEYARDLIEGRAVFLHRGGDQPILAALEQVAPNLWRLGDVKGVANKRVPSAVAADLSRTLRRESGLRLVGWNLVTAVVRVAGLAQAGKGSDADLYLPEDHHRTETDE